MTSFEPEMTIEAIKKRAASYRENDPDFSRWAKGYAVIAHTDETQFQNHALAERLNEQGVVPEPGYVYRVLAAADRISNAAMWPSAIFKADLL